MAGIDPAAVVPSYEAVKGPPRPSTLTVSPSRSVKSAEPSPTMTLTRHLEEGMSRKTSVEADASGHFSFVGPQRKRFHANRLEAPYPYPCGLEELSRFDLI